MSCVCCVSWSEVEGVEVEGHLLAHRLTFLQQAMALWERIKVGGEKKFFCIGIFYFVGSNGIEGEGYDWFYAPWPSH